uniref:Uncharacterized protein n=1 Tax=Panagrellus redivivus TaxID=6233 RepID=A0A7E4ZQ63_PANRE
MDVPLRKDRRSECAMKGEEEPADMSSPVRLAMPYAPALRGHPPRCQIGQLCSRTNYSTMTQEFESATVNNNPRQQPAGVCKAADGTVRRADLAAADGSGIGQKHLNGSGADGHSDWSYYGGFDKAAN